MLHYFVTIAYEARSMNYIPILDNKKMFRKRKLVRYTYEPGISTHRYFPNAAYMCSV